MSYRNNFNIVVWLRPALLNLWYSKKIPLDKFYTYNINVYLISKKKKSKVVHKNVQTV